MIDPVAAAIDVITTDPTVTALVGSRVWGGTDLEPGYTPADGPAIVVSVRGGELWHTHLPFPSLQYLCYAASEYEAMQVGRALVDLFVRNHATSEALKASVVDTLPQAYPAEEPGWYTCLVAFTHYLAD